MGVNKYNIAAKTIGYAIGGFIIFLIVYSLFFILLRKNEALLSDFFIIFMPFSILLGALFGMKKGMKGIKINKRYMINSVIQIILFAFLGFGFLTVLLYILIYLTPFHWFCGAYCAVWIYLPFTLFLFGLPVFTILGALIGLKKGLSDKKDAIEKYDEAIECYDEALKLNTNDEKAWYNKGAALSKTGKYDEAIECYDKALKLNPNKEEAWYNCACAYSIKGNIEKAIYNLTKAIDIDASFKEEANADKDFEKLRDDDAFKKLIG